MAYICKFNPGHHVYLDNQGDQTTITTTMGMPGQQQQASNGMTTGPWTAPPAAYQTAGGAVFKLFTAQGEICIYVQGNSVSMTGDVPSLAGAQPLSLQPTTAMPAPSVPPMQPMQPMQPMAMGNMQMAMNPMEMRMGNMELKMNSVDPPSANTPSASTPSAKTPSTETRKFCSQCGTKVAPEDRFCSNCGHNLSS